MAAPGRLKIMRGESLISPLDLMFTPFACKQWRKPFDRFIYFVNIFTSPRRFCKSN
jgi:hypothetical protein